MITRYGITFNYNGDRLRWIWPWARKQGLKYVSMKTVDRYKSLSHYWSLRATLEETMRRDKMMGFDLVSMVEAYVSVKSPSGKVVVVLGQKLLNKIKGNVLLDKHKVQTLGVFDSVMLRVDDSRDGVDLMRSIDPELGIAMLFTDGKVVQTNVNNDVKLIS